MKSVLIVLMASLAAAAAPAQERNPHFTRHFDTEEFASRRARVLEAMGEGAIAVIQGAPSPEGYTRFRQSNEFFYLTGVEVPHAYLLLDGAAERSVLFLPHRNEGREASEGAQLSAEDVDFLTSEVGFDAVYGPEMLAEQIGRATRRLRIVYTPMSPAEGLAESRDMGVRVIADVASDPWDGRPSREGHFVSLLRERFPALDIRDLSPVLDELRLIKSPRELAFIKKATALSGLALMEAMRSTEPGVVEAELDAVARFIYHRNHAQGDAYYSLVAGGTNAYRPHYHAGRSVLREGDLVLMDYAPDVGYYMSDVTRMWPVNGTFTPEQRQLYGFYLTAYRAILNHIGPGITPAQIRRRASVDMADALEDAEFARPEHRAAAERFVESYRAGADSPYASLGHWVGMATHDVGSYYGPLKPGMVFTIEPALRVPEEETYIRLEDLIIITENGKEIVSDFVPSDIEAIEELIEEEGMLQRYPHAPQTMWAED